MAKHVNPSGATPMEIEHKFGEFVENVKALVANHYETHLPTLDPDEIGVLPGRVYWKIVRRRASGVGGSVYGFVRKADGAIFKAATWKAPYTKGASAIRGYVTDDWAMDAATEYGIVYAR